MASYSTITFNDGSVSMPVRVEGVTSQNNLETLADDIKGYSNAVYTGVSVFYPNASPGSPTAATFQSVKDKALLTFRSSTNDIVKLTIPAPKASVFNTLNGVKAVTGTVGTALATSLSTATGKTLTFMKGRFVNKPGRA